MNRKVWTIVAAVVFALGVTGIAQQQAPAAKETTITGEVIANATIIPTISAAAAIIRRLRNSMRWAPIDMRLSRRGPSGTSIRGGPAVVTP